MSTSLPDADRGKLNVLFVDSAASEGGGQLSAERMLPALDGLSVAIAFLEEGVVADRLRARGIDVHTQPAGAGGLRGRAPWRSTRYLSALIKETRPDVVVALSTASARALAPVSRQGEVRLLRLSEDLDRYRGRGLKTLIYFAAVFPAFDGFISNSRWTASTLSHRLARKPTEIAFPISGVGDPASHKPSAILEGSNLRLITLSRPERWKGIDLAIEAACQAYARGVVDLELTIYGGGHNSDPDYTAELTRAAQAAPFRVTLAGHTSDVRRVIENCDVVLVPSRLPEPFGQVTVQALAAARLVVVSGHGGSLEIVKDGVTGLTFVPGSADDLCAQLVRISEDRDWARAIAQQGFDEVGQFTDGQTIAAMQAAIISLTQAVRAQR